MLDEPTSGHPELWGASGSLPSDRGPLENLKMWQEAESYLDHLCDVAERQTPNEAITCALVDCYNRCIEERRRAEDLLKLHARWRERRIGGVVEPEPVIVPKKGAAD